MKNIVSILIPVFNREDHIKECIDSALNQTYSNIEIIVVDNASTDKTWSICQKIKETDPRIKIFRNSYNLGPVMNWKKCLDYSSGDFIKVLFSDDLIHPKCVEMMLPKLELNADVGFVYSKTLIFKSSIKNGIVRYSIDKTGKYNSNEFIFNSLYTDKFPVSPGTAMFRRQDFVENLKIDIPNNINSNFSMHGIGADLILFLLISNKYKKFYYINSTLSYFRDHDGSISTSSNQRKRVLYYSLAKTFFVENYYREEKEQFYAYIQIIIIFFRYWDFGKKTRINDFFNEKESPSINIYLKALFWIIKRYIFKIANVGVTKK
jgi:glycosyltransferase involved in cell wall biosynthesis